MLQNFLIFSGFKAAATENSVVAVDKEDPEEEEVKPLEDETVNQIRKKMEKMKMNRDLEHIQVTLI